jgi:transaldolase/glucose-6-phosphate isomerase
MSSSISTLHALGQSLWYDNIQRSLLDNGGLAAMIRRGDIRGLTSNPSIFHNAIAKSRDYDAALIPMAWAGASAEKIFWRLAIEDIQAAADLLLPLYRVADSSDGYVSLEVSPYLAHDAAATARQAEQLWKTVERPNLMIKIPATPAGLTAIRQSIAAGINVNVTLIFSLARYLAVMDAYLAGLEDRVKAGQPIDHLASVASFFVSRIDTKIDGWLEKLGSSQALALRGKAAVANTRLAYQEFRKVFEGERFMLLKAKGARLQRPLWASTSAKNPAYADTIYVDHLIGPHTVNTVPPQTLDAFRDHGRAALTIETGVDEAQRVFDWLAELGISVDRATQELEMEGVKAFADAFTELLKSLETRRLQAVGELGPLAAPVARRISQLEEENVAARLHAIDPTLWTQDPKGQEEIRKRLGWLQLPETSRALIPELDAFAAEIRAAGLTHALLLGMGGSSLAPEVMQLTAGSTPGYLNLAIVDSTDPAQVRAAARRSPVGQTLYIVSSKSGGTAEVNALLSYFWARARHAVGERAAEHFIAITDPGTSLEKLARERGFRRVFLGDPTVGGRYSALSPFGLAPAALIGLDLDSLLARAAWMARQCAANMSPARNPGMALGALMGEAARQGRDKLTLLADPEVASFGSWLEQLIAESSGKHGVGIVPIDLEPPAAPAQYGIDRWFAYLRVSGQHDRLAARLLKAGLPVLTFLMTDVYDLGAEFYRWGVAAAMACHVLGVNAFDQPDVQDNKDRTTAKIRLYQAEGRLAEGRFVQWDVNNVVALLDFLAQARPGDYVAINAYLPRNTRTIAWLQALRSIVRQRTGCATTVGFGPRFLHSTGQLHKGGADNGLFLQITADPVIDLDIPGQGMTFGTLARAQALGDLEALEARGRRALRVHLPSPEALRQLVERMKL